MQINNYKLNFLILLFCLAFIIPVQAVAQSSQPSAAIETAGRFYSIEGEVQKPGRYGLSQGMRVKSAIEAAGGLTNNADPKRSEIIRFHKSQKTYFTIYFQADNALNGDLADNFILLHEDRIIIPAIPKQIDAKRRELPAVKTRPGVETKKPKEMMVFVEGEAVKPGAYPYKENMTVRDMIIDSGGTLKTSFPEQAELVAAAPGAVRKTVNLKKAMDDDSEHNLPVSGNDRLVIRNMPEDGKSGANYVTLSGEVLFPGKYPITKGERLLSVIERAGGYTSWAYPRAAVFTKERVRHIQQNCLEKVATRIEREPLAKSKHKDATQRLLQQMRAFKVSGRIKAYVASQDMPQDRAFDIELENGDTFDVPSLPDTVNVAGAVRRPGFYGHNGQSDFRDYIKAAGGFTAIADEPAVFVVKADGNMRDVGKAFVEWSRKAKRMEFGD